MKICLINNRNLRSCIGCFLFVFCLIITVILPNSVSGNMEMDRNVVSTDEIKIFPEELILLPRWCQIRMLAHPRIFNHTDAGDVPDSVMHENAKWEKVIGREVYHSCHHYCRALNMILRYKRYLGSQYKVSETDRRFILKKALSDFQYMKNIKIIKNNKLYNPILMNEAYIYRELGDLKKAIINYMEIMKREPGYAPAYVEYAKLLDSVGQTADAIKVLKVGLQKTKGAKSIKQAMTAMESGEVTN